MNSTYFYYKVKEKKLILKILKIYILLLKKIKFLPNSLKTLDN